MSDNIHVDMFNTAVGILEKLDVQQQINYEKFLNKDGVREALIYQYDLPEFTFDIALNKLRDIKNGKVARKRWVGYRNWLQLRKKRYLTARGFIKESDDVDIYLYTQDTPGDDVRIWEPTNADLLAKDWFIVDRD